MRKVLLSVYFFFVAMFIMAQLTVTGNYQILNKKNGVKVIIFDSITSDNKIEYIGTKVKYFEYNNPTETFLLPPSDATGYIIEVDSVNADTIFVLDYSNYHPKFTTLEIENDPKNQCENVNLLLTANIPALRYFTPSGTAYNLERDFEVKYKTLEFLEKWNTIDTTETILLPSNTLVSRKIAIKAPLCDTYFTLFGDQYAKELDKNQSKLLSIDSIVSPLYSAVAVKCHPVFIVEKREELNEENRPSISSQDKFSAPLSVEFLSNANEPVTTSYKWEIFKNKQLLIPRTSKDHRYTFTDAGEYEVKLMVSNSTLCKDSGVISISVTESSLLVPNVFTPNGDGQNDEFRVAYKSIITFQAWVYNRWGRKVFSWSDPQKGWDGNINGKKATTGPYFYVIKATGSDGVKYLKKGDINLLRGVEK